MCTLAPPKLVRSTLIAFVFACGSSIGARPCGAQAREGITKYIDSVEVVENRPGVQGKPAGGVPGSSGATARGVYVADENFPVTAPAAGTWRARVGVTVWRARPVTTADGPDAARELLAGQSITFARVSDQEVQGDKAVLRVGIEALSGEGYLYVVGRDKLRDGTLTPPVLLYPAPAGNERENFIGPGRVVVVPGPDRSFTLEDGIKPQRGVSIEKLLAQMRMSKELSIFLSPTPLKLPAGAGSVPPRLEQTFVDEWERRSGGRMYRAALRRNIGLALSSREKTSSRQGAGAGLLTRNDPLPQAYFKGDVAQGAPALVKIELLREHPDPNVSKTVLGSRNIELFGDSSDGGREGFEPVGPYESNEQVVTDENGEKRVVAGTLTGKAIEKPVPEYPAIAKAARASGPVVVSITVDESGRVISATVESGHPLLQKAARLAALRARFAPTTLSGYPVKVMGTIMYNFVLLDDDSAPAAAPEAPKP